MAKTSKKKRKSGKTKRTTTKKRRTTKIKYESTKEIKVEKALIDNFISLQKVMVNLSAKFDDLSKQISKLLELFEISAKSLAQKDLEKEKSDTDTRKILEKLDNISKQSGLIGRGLALIHETGSERERVPEIKPRPAPMPVRPSQGPPTLPRRQGQGMQGYQKSISSRTLEENA